MRDAPRWRRPARVESRDDRGSRRMLNVYVATGKQTKRFQHDAGPIEFGRESKTGPAPARHVLKDPYVSADQLRVLERPGEQVRLENLSRRVVVTFSDGGTLEPGATGEFGLSLVTTVQR